LELLTLIAAIPTTPGPRPDGLFAFLQMWGLPIILLIIFWFLIIGGNRRRERERKALLSNIKKGDRLRMIGGEFGSVVELKDDRVLLKVDETSNTKIWYARDAVSGVEKE
jgi:preprotein translocase subunit YajC